MHVLHFCPSRSFSGMEQYVLDIVKDQKARGFEVTLVAHPGYELSKQASALGVSVIAFDPFQPRASFAFARLFSSYLHSNPSLNIFHLHSTQDLSYVFWPLWKLPKAKRSKIKVVLQNHIWIERSKKDPIHWALYRQVDEVWCSSERARDALASCLPVPDDKIRVIHYGRDITKIENSFLPKMKAREQLALPASGIVFGCISRIEKGKGVREYLQAMVGIVKENKNVSAVLIGGASPENQEAESYFADLMKYYEGLSPEIRKRIYLLGSIPDAARFLRAFDIYVLPSYLECFSLSMLDAQLAGLPIVGTNTGGTPDVVISSDTGWLVGAKSDSELIRGLQAALADEALWSEFGSRAAERVKKHFDKTKVFDGIARMYAD